jgi:glycerol-3-phosphate dehydrogenase
MARTIEDILSRRTRALLLDVKAAVEAAPRVARLLAEKLSRDSAWETNQVQEFSALAKHYSLN